MPHPVPQNDPIAEIINSVTADVIGFCSVRSFEQFKESAEQLNMIGVYQNLTTRAAGLGLNVSKVVFRGYMAPQRLQKMHDDAIERRTKLVLERVRRGRRAHGASPKGRPPSRAACPTRAPAAARVSTPAPC